MKKNRAKKKKKESFWNKIMEHIYVYLWVYLLIMAFFGVLIIIFFHAFDKPFNPEAECQDNPDAEGCVCEQYEQGNEIIRGIYRANTGEELFVDYSPKELCGDIDLDKQVCNTSIPSSIGTLNLRFDLIDVNTIQSCTKARPANIEINIEEEKNLSVEKLKNKGCGWLYDKLVRESCRLKQSCLVFSKIYNLQNLKQAWREHINEDGTMGCEI